MWAKYEETQKFMTVNRFSKITDINWLLTPFHVTGDFNISDSTSNNTSADPCSYFFSSCLFLAYISLRFHDLTERDIKLSLRT